MTTKAYFGRIGRVKVNLVRQVKSRYYVIVRTGNNKKEDAFMEYTLKTFTIDGKPMQFNTYLFDSCFKDYCKKNKTSLGKMAIQIAEELCVSDEAVRNWRKGINSPSDLEKISDLENILGLETGRLLRTVQEDSEMERLTDRQLTAAKKIYDAIIDFLNDFKDTEGFNTIWLDEKRRGNDDPVGAAYDYIEAKEKVIEVLLEKEFFDLRGTELYDELNEFVYGDLVDAYNEKIGFMYRFSFASDDPGRRAYEDYYEAMEKLNAIIEKYV